MTPLEARRLLFKDEVLDKTEIPVKLARAKSLENVKKNTTLKLKNNPHIDDSIRRASSYYKLKSKSISNLLSS